MLDFNDTSGLIGFESELSSSVAVKDLRLLEVLRPLRFDFRLLLVLLCLPVGVPGLHVRAGEDEEDRVEREVDGR